MYDEQCHPGMHECGSQPMHRSYNFTGGTTGRRESMLLAPLGLPMVFNITGPFGKKGDLLNVWQRYMTSMIENGSKSLPRTFYICGTRGAQYYLP